MKKTSNYYIGHVTNKEHRFKASSGGLGTLLQKHLLLSREYQTSITFRFNSKKCMYEPELIHSHEDVNICGSVYQEINLVEFLRANISNIVGKIVLSCPPCQVTAIRQILKESHIDSFIISFCCSKQTTIEGTWKYYEFLGIEKSQIENMQYRGNGWPSGIQIWLKDNTIVYRDNYTAPWSIIHDAGFYSPKRCYYCKFDTSYSSDVSLADPWLKEYLEKDKIGNTMFIINSEKGQSIIDTLVDLKLFIYNRCEYNDYYTAQKPNIEKLNNIENQKRYLRRITSIIENKRVRTYFTKTPKRMKQFKTIRQKIKDFSSNKNFTSMVLRIFRKIMNKVRYLLMSKKIGSHDGPFNIRGGGNY